MKIEKSQFRYFIIANVFVLAASICCVTTANAQSKKAVLDLIEGNYRGLSSMTANVTMVKENPQIGSRDITEGTTSFLPETVKPKRDMYVRIDWIKPAKESMVVIGNSYKIYREKTRTFIEGTKASAKNNAAAGGVLSLVSMSKARMMSDYDIYVDGRESLSDKTATTHLILRPKVKMDIKRAEMWVDDNGMPRQIKVTQFDDETTTILLTNIKINPVLKASAFVLKVPPGIKPIQG